MNGSTKAVLVAVAAMFAAGCKNGVLGGNGGDTGWCPAAKPLCTGGDCTLDLPLTTASITGSVKWNGAAIPDTTSGYDEWVLTFVDPATKVSYTATFNGGTNTYSVPMYVGTWDVYFSFAYSNVVLGQVNGSTRIAKNFQVADGATLDIDPKPVTVSGAISWDGQTIPDVTTGYDEWLLIFVDRNTKQELAHTFNGGTSTYSALVYPGDYDVYFDFEYSGILPDQLNGKHKVANALHLSSDTTLDVTPELVTLSGNVRYDDQVIPDTTTGYDEWMLKIASPSGDESYVKTFNGGAQTYSMKVYPGTWDVLFDFEYSGILPNQISGLHKIAGAKSITADSTLDVTPTLVNITGSVSWNAQQIPDATTGYDEWMLLFANGPEKYSVTFNGGTGTYAMKMYPGTWDVSFDFLYSGIFADQVSGLRHLVRGKSFQGDATLDISPVLAPITGQAQWNGAAIPDATTGYDEWFLTFVDRSGGDTFTVPFNGGSATYAAKMYPGTWDVFFDFNYSGIVPEQVNGKHRIESGFTIPEAGTTLDVNPELVTVHGATTWNGATIPDTTNGYDEWTLRFRNEATDETFDATFNGGTPDYTLKMYPGTWDVWFDFAYSGIMPNQISGARRVQACGGLS